MTEPNRKLAVTMRHVAFEDLGSFDPAPRQAGYDVLYVDAPFDSLDDLKELDPGLVIVLGGPIGVYQQEDFPFLRREIDFLSRRLDQSKPTIGICLGSQLIAAALGARVYPGPCKEIGWKGITLTEAEERSPLSHLVGMDNPGQIRGQAAFFSYFAHSLTSMLRRRGGTRKLVEK